MQYGICPNYPYRCKNAKNKTLLHFSRGGNCPNCGRALRPTRRPLWMVAMLALSLGLGLIALSNYSGLMHTDGKAYASADAGTTVPPKTNAPPVELVKAHTLLRISGSTTIGDLGAPMLAHGWLVSMGAEASSLQTRPLIEAVENGEKQRVGKIVSGVLNGKAVQVLIRHRGSKYGFLDLKANDADVAMSSRAINAAELATAKEAGLGDMKSRFAETVIGLDGIAIIVARDNPVAQKGLTLQQVRDIFTGRIRDWSEVGGPARKIKLYIRTPGSGTYDTFRDLVLGKEAVPEPRTVIEDSQEIDARVGTDRDAIGFVSSGLVAESTAVAIGEDGYPTLKPSIATVKSENYLLRRRLYLYRREADPRSPQASAFVTYAKSDEGQAQMRKAHLIDLIPLPADAAFAAREDCALSDKYQRIYQRSTNSLCDLQARNVKLPVTFFFDFDSPQPELENLGFDQIERVVRQVQTQSTQKLKNIELAGFADTRGDYLYNCQLALERAKTVARYLTEQGIVVRRNVSFCSEAALVSSNTDEGLRQNRRVEVYIDK